MRSETAVNTQYLSLLLRAYAAVGRALGERIPPDITIKTRERGVVELRPGNHGYEAAFRRFVRTICSSETVLLMVFLYQFEHYLSLHEQAFADQYQRFFDPKKWKAVKHDFPSIDQTTVATVLGIMSPTAVGNRLEDLSRIGFVIRSDMDPPRPKFVRISSVGIDAINAASIEGRLLLEQLFVSAVDPAWNAELTGPRTIERQSRRSRL